MLKWILLGLWGAQVWGATNVVELVPPPAPSPKIINSRLIEAARFPAQRATGVAVSRKGRVFVCFPRWNDPISYSVGEVLPDGRTDRFPDVNWNNWNPAISAAERFVCVQSVTVDDDDNLWALDAAAPQMGEVRSGGAKLVKISLVRNNIDKIYYFPSSAILSSSYLNDVRVDVKHHFAYVTDSGSPALITVNLETGEMRRLLEDHPSTQPDFDFALQVMGRLLFDSERNSPPKVGVDGIAYDPKGDSIYYHALTGRNLFRIAGAVLRGARTREALNRAVQNLGETGASDGLWWDGNRVLLTGIEDGSIRIWNSDYSVKTLVRDDRLRWPDSLVVAPNGYLYITASQIEKSPRFNGGEDRRTEPYILWRYPLHTP